MKIQNYEVYRKINGGYIVKVELRHKDIIPTILELIKMWFSKQAAIVEAEVSDATIVHSKMMN